MTHMMINHSAAIEQFRIVPAQVVDIERVVALFGTLHSYNASLDSHFALADDWRTLLRHEFRTTWKSPEHLWLLVTDGQRAVGLLIGAVHSDSLIFRYRRWVEVEALYVDADYRCLGIATSLLNQTYQWAEAQGINRVQLYVTASNERAQSVYMEHGFSVTQAIMRKSL